MELNRSSGRSGTAGSTGAHRRSGIARGEDQGGLGIARCAGREIPGVGGAASGVFRSVQSYVLPDCDAVARDRYPVGVRGKFWRGLEDRSQTGADDSPDRRRSWKPTGDCRRIVDSD